MSANNNAGSTPLSSLAAAAAKLSVTTPTKATGAGMTGGAYETPKKAKSSPNKKLSSKRYERGTKEGNRNIRHRDHTHKRTPRQQRGRRDKETPSKASGNGGTPKGYNSGGRGRKEKSHGNRNQFEFYLNGSDSDESSEHEKYEEHRRDEKESKSPFQKHRSPGQRYNGGNDRGNIKHNDTQRKEDISNRRRNNGNANGKVIDVNVSRRLIGHALGKRIPTSDQKRQRNSLEIPNPNPNPGKQSRSKLQNEKTKFSSPSETHSSPVLIPSSQLHGPIKVAEMKRWADEDSSDED